MKHGSSFTLAIQIGLGVRVLRPVSICLVAFLDSLVLQAEYAPFALSTNVVKWVKVLSTRGALEKPQRLNMLGSLLVMRYERIGASEDLAWEIEILKSALSTMQQQQQPDRVRYSNNLAIALGQRYNLTGGIKDVDDALESLSWVTIVENPAGPTLYNIRGVRLLKRFEYRKNIQDLNDSTDCFRLALRSNSSKEPDQPFWLNNLANALGIRFEQQNTMDDLNRAIKVLGTAMPKDHPDRAQMFGNLGTRLRTRLYQSRKKSDLNASLDAFQKGWYCENATPSVRVRLARQAADIIASVENWEEALLFLDGGVRLLSILSARSLRHSDKQRVLSDYSGLASLAASVALSAGKEAFHALELLETGRSLISSLVLGESSEISDLRQHHPKLAYEYEAICAELDSPTDPESSFRPTGRVETYALRLQRRHEAENRLNRLIMIIRAQLGFHYFLLPPTAHDMMAAASPDPIIVINASYFRCDAIIVEKDRLSVVTLPHLDREKVREKARPGSLASLHHRSSMLEWLWDAVTYPILEALGYTHLEPGSNLPHVWWIATGSFCHLPLHAAGYHKFDCTDTVLDRVSSSYTLSIRTLIYGRRRHGLESPSDPHDQALLLAMHKTPNRATLRFTIDEIEVVSNLCPSLRLQPNRPDPRKEDVLRYLHRCKIFHFAGHGRVDRFEPSESNLLLEDWETSPLTVGDLRDRKPEVTLPFLAYLSPCSTGAVGEDRFLDEGINLVSA